MTGAKPGARSVHLRAPIVSGDTTIASISLRPWKYRDTRRWEAGEFDGARGIIEELLMSLSGLTGDQLDEMEYPDIDVVFETMYAHLPEPVRNAIMAGEIPRSVEPVSMVSAEDAADIRRRAADADVPMDPWAHLGPDAQDEAPPLTPETYPIRSNDPGVRAAAAFKSGARAREDIPPDLMPKFGPDGRLVEGTEFASGIADAPADGRVIEPAEHREDRPALSTQEQAAVNRRSNLMGVDFGDGFQ